MLLAGTAAALLFISMTSCAAAAATAVNHRFRPW